MLSLDIARSSLAVHGRERIGRSLRRPRGCATASAPRGRFRELSERFLASPGVVAVDPLRVVIDTRSGGISGHEARQILFDAPPDPHRDGDRQRGRRRHRRRRRARCPARARRARRAARPRRGRQVRRSRSRSPGRRSCRCARRTSRRPSSCPPSTPSAACRRTRSPPTRRASPTCCPASSSPPRRATSCATAAAPFGHVRGAVDPSLTKMRVLTNPE